MDSLKTTEQTGCYIWIVGRSLQGNREDSLKEKNDSSNFASASGDFFLPFPTRPYQNADKHFNVLSAI